jgi:hypothetical protein
VKSVDRDYWQLRTELKGLLNQPLPGGRGYQEQQDKNIHRLCKAIAEYGTPVRRN